MADAVGSKANDVPGSRLALSVVAAMPDGPTRLRKLLRCLSEQTIAPEMEVVIVAPTAESSDIDGDAFGRLTIVPVGPIDDVDRSLASGINAARAPIVAIIEDHAYPEPGWAEALVDAHRGPSALVGPAFANANPSSTLSWANMMIAYGNWLETTTSGVVDEVSRHNVSAKRDVLLEYGPDLPDRLVRGGGLLEDLRARGRESYLESRARVHHVNPSQLTSTLRLRVDSGRLHAARRAERGRWSSVRRLVYVGGSPLIPLVRLSQLVPPLYARPPLRRPLLRSLPALLLALTADAAGQAIGFIAGPGASEDRLAAFELDRWKQVRKADRAILAP